MTSKMVWIVSYWFRMPSGDLKQSMDLYQSHHDADEMANRMRAILEVYSTVEVRGRDVQTPEYVESIRGAARKLSAQADVA